uniref:Uncharacterized protein n=1 Tax=Klebsiella pneumoniae TaxID=573 RepID=A0A2P1BPJ6_KLEPN|nr:hypothetical protein [Klebsiella pneumoniae]
MIPYVVYTELSEHPVCKATLYQRIFTPRNQPCATLFQPCFESGCRFDFSLPSVSGFYRACTERRTEIH